MLASKKLVSSSEHTPKLAGLRYVVKDVIGVAGEHMLMGNPIWQKTRGLNPAALDAIVVRQLNTHGAIYRGIKPGDDSAFSLSGLDNHLPLDEFGNPKRFVNPHDATRITGGSSSGVAEALATHTTAENALEFVIGSDTGGSIRVPAAYCGLLGWRPSWGLVSLAGVAPNVPSCDTVGVMARDAAILARVAAVLTSLPKSTVNAAPGRIYILNDVLSLCDPTVQAVFHQAQVALNQLYPECLQRITLADIMQAPSTVEQWVNSALNYMFGEIASELGGDVQAFGQAAFTPAVWGNFTAALAIPDNMVVIAREQFMHYRQALRQFLNPHDLLLLPTVPTIAPKITESECLIAELKNTFAFTCYGSIAGLPQVTIPFGTCQVDADTALPVGVSLMAAYEADLWLLEHVKTICQHLGSYSQDAPSNPKFSSEKIRSAR